MKRACYRDKKAQMELSFGMIFTIMLIIVFVAFAIWAVYKFLDMSDEVLLGKFKSKFQEDIDNIWKSSQGSQEYEYNIPKSITEICFVDETYNLQFISDEIFNSVAIKHLDINKILDRDDKYCIENVNKKIKIALKKDFGEDLVYIG